MRSGYALDRYDRGGVVYHEGVALRTIIAGSRGINSYMLLEECLQDVPFTPTVVISGGARGVDKLGEMWAVARYIPVEVYPAEWDKYGRRAGYERNKLMASKAEALVALWDGESRGTEHMITIAKEKGLTVHVFDLSKR